MKQSKGLVVGILFFATLLLSLSALAIPGYATPAISFNGYGRSGNTIILYFQVWGTYSSDMIKTETDITDSWASSWGNCCKTSYIYFYGPGYKAASVSFPFTKGHPIHVFFMVSVPNTGGWTPNYVQYVTYDFTG